MPQPRALAHAYMGPSGLGWAASEWEQRSEPGWFCRTPAPVLCMAGARSHNLVALALPHVCTAGILGPVRGRILVHGIGLGPSKVQMEAKARSCQSQTLTEV